MRTCLRGREEGACCSAAAAVGVALVLSLTTSNLLLTPTIPPIPPPPPPPPLLLPAALELSQRGMLPAIWFIFSRKECDLAAKQLEIHGVTLTTPEGAHEACACAQAAYLKCVPP